MTESGVVISTHAENFVVDLEESAKTGILVAYDNILIGVLGVADPLKREAAVVIEGLNKMGVNPVMVTGDNWRTAQAVAKEVCLLFCISNRFIHVKQGIINNTLWSAVICFQSSAFAFSLKIFINGSLLIKKILDTFSNWRLLWHYIRAFMQCKNRKICIVELSIHF